MEFFLDENVPASVGAVLRERGHGVELAQDKVARGSPDHLLAVIADQKQVVLVSFDKDFRGMIQRESKKGLAYPTAGRLSLRIAEVDAAERLRFELPLIEAAWQSRQGLDDKRLIAEIKPKSVVIY